MNYVNYTIKTCKCKTSFKLATIFSSYEPPRDSEKPEDIEYWKEAEELSKPIVYDVYLELVDDNGNLLNYIKLSSATYKKLTKEEFEGEL